MQTHILGLLTPMISLGFAATFIALWHIGKLKRHVLGFGLSYVFFCIGFLLTHLLPGEAFYVFHTTQLFYSIGITIFTAALADRVGQRIHMPTFLAIYALSATALAFAVVLSDNVDTRLIIVNNGYGAMGIAGLVTLLSVQKRSLVDTALIIMMSINTADYFIRPVFTLMFETSIPEEGYRDSVYYALIGLVLGVRSVGTSMLLVGATIFEWNKAVRESGERDALTGLRNKGAFEEMAHTLLPRAEAEGRPFSLVVADIDHFKQVNDIWGHQAGDAAISGFGHLIENMIRSSDSAGRIGGEEFCIIVWDCPNAPAQRLADRIRKAFERLEHEGVSDDIRLTASFGVATAREGESYERLFSRADAALYEAKSSGRNRVENAEREIPDEPDETETLGAEELKPASNG